MNVVEFITSNLGMGLEDLILFGTALSCIIPAIKDVRIGVMAALIMFTGEFVMFYELGMNYIKALILVFVSVVILALSLLIGYQKSTRWVI